MADFSYRKIQAENRIIELCQQINEELEHEQKIIILIYLLDFIQMRKETHPDRSQSGPDRIRLSEDQ